MSKDLENLLIYKNHVDLMYYSFKIMEKFPKFEKHALCVDIKHSLYDCLKCILYAFRTHNYKDKVTYLGNLDINLKVLKVLVRISYKNKYINSNNYGAWSRKISNVSNNMIGWIKYCQKR